MKKIIFGLIVCVVFISGCSSRMKEKPADISLDIWDDSIQYAIMADQYKGTDSDIDLVELMSTAGKLKYLKDQNKNEQDLTNNVRNMVVGKFEEYYGYENGVENFKEARKAVVSIIGEGMLNKKNLKDDYANGISKKLEAAEDKPEGYSYKKAYQEDHQLKAKDVQYDMVNNLDKEFVLEGTASLDDYYNYGFDSSIESSYFCARVIPDDGSDSWYVYVHRKSFGKLFEALKSGDVHVTTTSKIPSNRFEKGQGNMAQVQQVRW
ncbi:hypothetical protein [Paenibacillus sp. FSL R10-2734]|uniref:hypothetical protein n=1 Tax=Paenibacillus sp. FSL R10-2734 TaxID=2954691 RepID=UPI0030DBF1AA